jgi:uncharacterized protein (TIGR00645 family)
MYERMIERFLYGSRWLLSPMYAGLAIVLIAFVYKFAEETIHIFAELVRGGEHDLVLGALALVDLVLVASLLLMVMISGYENFVSRIDLKQSEERLAWFGKLDAGTLKVKVAASIVAISSIHLLRVFLNVEKIPDNKIMWLVIMHLTFVVSALLVGFLDKLSSKHASTP